MHEYIVDHETYCRYRLCTHYCFIRWGIAVTYLKEWLKLISLSWINWEELIFDFRSANTHSQLGMASDRKQKIKVSAFLS